MDQHYDCRACCRDESVCSIPQCDTGLTSPGCHMDQGPEIVDEDLPSPQVPRDWQDQGPALPSPSNIPVEHGIVDEDLLPPQVSGDEQDQGPEIVDEDQLSRQVSRERLTDRPRTGKAGMQESSGTGGGYGGGGVLGHDGHAG